MRGRCPRRQRRPGTWWSSSPTAAPIAPPTRHELQAPKCWNGRLMRTPGKAASINDGLAWAREREWDALVTIDADTIVGDGFLVECDRILQAGAQVAQAREECLVGRV